MKEDQHIEWKEVWRDEYLRGVCAFANAEGGVMTIGRNNKGEAVGVENAQQLLVELPNKIRDMLGIMVGVHLVRKAGKELIEIRVDPYPTPISYKGEYYFRSGSTKQELKGAALSRFLLRKQGRTWDSVPTPNVALRNLSKSAIAKFRKLAKQSRRLHTATLKERDSVLIEKLDLVEGTYPKRAAVLLFHPEPEKFFPGAYVKIGYFQTESDLLYHDEIHGDLFTQAEKTIDLLTTKYLKASISYRGIQRLETLPVPEEALRESVLNALIHRDYDIGAPIQIRVYADRLRIWNPGELPENWSLEKLLKPHASRPFNPSIANAFFRAGEVESWGRGIQRIFDACRAAKVKKPVIQYEKGDIWIEFSFAKRPEGKMRASEETSEETSEEILSRTPERILQMMKQNEKVTASEVANALGLSRRAIEQQVQKLKKEKRIRRLGSTKAGKWKVFELRSKT